MNQPDDITLDSDAITLPAAVTSKLSGVDSIVVASACPQDLNEINHYRPTSTPS